MVVRRARSGEKLLLLDGQEVALDAETLLITDADGPIAIAGVMGGERSGISARTTNVFLECAFFRAARDRRHGAPLRSSNRCVPTVRTRGGSRPAIRGDGACDALLLDIVGGKPGPGRRYRLAGASAASRVRSMLRRSRLDLYVGEPTDADEVTRTFTRLEFQPQLERGDDDVWSIDVPSHRFDIEREVDLIEEVCRVRGYDRIPMRMPTDATRTGPAAARRDAARAREAAARGSRLSGSDHVQLH